jgi:hypothetical protein
MSGNHYSASWGRRGTYEFESASVINYSSTVLEHTPIEPVQQDNLSNVTEGLQQALGLIGVPGVQAAYREARQNSAAPQLVDWSHPVVYMAGCITGWEPLHNSDCDAVLPVFQEHYRALCLCLLAGIKCEAPNGAVAQYQ